MLGTHQRMKTKTLYGVYSPERGKLRIRKQKDAVEKNENAEEK